ncbi:Uma2 family endonuclease [Microcoleus sp. AR_TQ3_B6]|uniref:Uma2 family endonuclease n=1 Tax=Microcoleus sp. AR_TQ3_B6 TaxID=3055284 RepID=UPI002FD6E357
MPPPALVVEVVSPGKVNEDRDYRYKRSEYAARGIPEYWIVDPGQAKVTVLMWVDGLYEEAVFQGSNSIVTVLMCVDGLYEEAVFQGSNSIVSTTFPDQKLTAAQVLGAGEA